MRIKKRHVGGLLVVVVIAWIVAWGLLHDQPEPVADFKFVADGQYFGNTAVADVNGDGLADTAFIFTQSPGGSGTFYYIVVALKEGDGWVGTNPVLLGDRIAPQSTEIHNGIITVNYAQRKPGEPFTTAPSVGVSKRLDVRARVLSVI